jgi:hypothetical protein
MQLQRFVAQSEKHYRNIDITDPNKKQYLKGRLNRAGIYHRRQTMARQAQKNAQSTFDAAQGVRQQGSQLFNQANSNAEAIINQLAPEYQAEINNPQGIGASGLAAENTAAQQSTGGSVAGLVGQGNLTAARTRNAGGFGAALDESSRQAMRQNAQDAVGIQANNENLKEQQRQEGLAGLEGLYGINANQVLGALGAENSSLGEQTGANNSLTQAGQSGWLQNTLGVLGTLGSLGTGAGAVNLKFPCWIAAELYGGWDDPRVSLIRNWLHGEFSKSCMGRFAVSLYMRFGERMAERIKHSLTLRKIMRFLFDRALKRALRASI